MVMSVICSALTTPKPPGRFEFGSKLYRLTARSGCSSLARRPAADSR